jgi:uncharacterized protein YaiE (UPF0345 family)
MSNIIIAVAIVLFAGIGMILKAEWDMLNSEAEELHVLRGELPSRDSGDLKESNSGEEQTVQV